MLSKTGSLIQIQDLQHSCYSKDFLPIREIKEKSLLLFTNELWEMLLYVKYAGTETTQEVLFLMVDILSYQGCSIPSRTQDIYFCGVTIDVEKGGAKIVRIPFIKVGWKFLLSENVRVGMPVDGLFYEIGAMYVLDPERFS